MARSILSSLVFLFAIILPEFSCSGKDPYNVVPARYVYSIIERRDSLYCSTRNGEVFRLSPDRPQEVIRLGLPRFHPLRTLVFRRNGDLLASSYESGVYRVTADSLHAVRGFERPAWSMSLDDDDRLWMAGRHGVFRQQGDSLLRHTALREAYDLDFFLGKLAVAHYEGITLYDSSTEAAETTFCAGIPCWSLDVRDSLLVGTGAGICLLLHGNKPITIPLEPEKNLPWDADVDAKGNIYLATQKGLYMIRSGTRVAKCIGFSGKCVKSLHIDRKGRLWTGTYF